MTAINVHIFFQILTFNAMHLFGPIFFYEMGLPLSLILVYWTCFFAIRIPVRPILLRIFQRLRGKEAFFIATLLFNGRYPIYLLVESDLRYLPLLLIYEAISGTIYWLLYHTYFTILGTNETGGRQTALREASIYAAQLIAPLTVGALISSYGFGTAFWSATAISLLSLLPICWLPQRKEAVQPFPLKSIFQIDRSGFWYYFTAGAHIILHVRLWGLVLYLAVGDYTQYGVFVTIAIAAQILCTLVIGNLFDRGKAVRIAQGALWGIALLIAVRSTMPLTAVTVVATDMLFALGSALSNPALMASQYNRSRASHQPLRYQFLSEAGWDFGSVIAGLLGFLLLSQHIEPQALMGAAMFAVIAQALALKHWAKLPRQST